MTVKELLLDHLTCTFETETWQPPLSMAVDGLTARQAAWKPSPERHSIWQIVRHVILWKQGVLDAWDDRVPDEGSLERADWQEVSGDDAAWQADVRMLHEVTRTFKERVHGLDDAGLGRMMPTYRGYPDQPIAIRIARMATHDIYHAGQIRYLRALQGA
ncbi:MAG: DinB family protein [Armatimonadota bacterium]|nr:DinB family protein [Armatimonadota bacterium]MDR7548747.1 DinB family protein [Armatimonadota bacterium]